jgi:hypothetical protein
MDRETRELLERGVAAIERLAQDPVIEMQTGPPVCPHCGAMNPTVKVDDQAGEGLLGDFVIRAQCQCGEVFYAIPVQWDNVGSMEEAAQVISERNDLRGFNGGEDQRAQT